MKGSTNTSKFKKFQIRWAEKLGYENNPYLIRWTFIFFGYSMRIHHWIKSDDNRFFHDHSAVAQALIIRKNDYISNISYIAVIPNDPAKRNCLAVFSQTADI